LTVILDASTNKNVISALCEDGEEKMEKVEMGKNFTSREIGKEDVDTQLGVH
jgi:hypothetical protein